MSQETPKTIENVKYPEIAGELFMMAEKDQAARNDTKVSYGEDSDLWKLDKVHEFRLKEIVQEIGWPTISKVGRKSSHEAWLLVQHVPDTSFQKSCLDLMKKESASEVEPSCVAFLTDRIRVREGRPQIYGTQYMDIDGKYVLRPIDDEEGVNDRRRAMGISETVEEQISGAEESRK